MLELLMCISLVCFNNGDNYHYIEYPQQSYIKILEKDTMFDIGSDKSYERYWGMFKGKRWSCYYEEDAKMIYNP